MNRRNPLVILLTLALLVLTSPAVLLHHQATHHLNHAIQLSLAWVEQGDHVSHAPESESIPASPVKGEQDCPACHLLAHSHAMPSTDPMPAGLRLAALFGRLQGSSVHWPQQLYLSDLGGRDPPAFLSMV